MKKTISEKQFYAFLAGETDINGWNFGDRGGKQNLPFWWRGLLSQLSKKRKNGRIKLDLYL